MLSKFILPMGLLALALTACTGAEEIDKAPEAQVVDAPKVEPKVEEAPTAPTGTPVKVDAAASKIEWLGAKVTGTHDGGFKTFDGEVLVDGDAVVGTQFTIDLTSLWSDAEKLTNHLKSADFFDVEKFTSASFKATSITPKAAEGATHEVVGELDLHGEKKVITFPASINVDAAAVKVTSEFQLKRSDFGITYPGKPDDLIKDEVAVKLDLTFPRGEAAAAPADAAPADAAAPAGAPAAPAPKAAPAGNADAPAKKGAPEAPATGATKGGEKKAAPAPAPSGATQGGAKKGGEKK